MGRQQMISTLKTALTQSKKIRDIKNNLQEQFVIKDCLL